MSVPNVPGVPALFQTSKTVQNVLLLVADAVAVLALFSRVNWGIYDQNGRALIIGDSVKELDFDNEFRISDFPVEDGGFASYNKVATPFDVRVTFTKGGSKSERASFIAALDAILKSLALVNVVTSEVTYIGVNVVRYGYRRTARQGATLLTIDVFCRQVREFATEQFSSSGPNGVSTSSGTNSGGNVTIGQPTISNDTAQSPTSASPSNDGTVQPQPPTTAQTTIVQHGATGSF